MRQMKVDKLGIDLLTHDPVVILKDLEGKRYLPILIGPFEATAIALALGRHSPCRGRSRTT
jgi:bifunctional DNase/RNase